jgi:hypothetical protein
MHNGTIILNCASDKTVCEPGINLTVIYNKLDLSAVYPACGICFRYRDLETIQTVVASFGYQRREIVDVAQHDFIRRKSRNCAPK